MRISSTVNYHDPAGDHYSETLPRLTAVALMYELDVGCVEDDDGADATATATASSGPSQRMHGSDLQNDAEWETESSGDEGEEDEAITPEFDHEDDEEHALGRVQSHGVDKTPVRTIPVETPGLEHPTAGAKERLEEEDEAAVINANADKGIRIVVSKAIEESKDYFDNIVTERGFVAAVQVH